MKLIGVGVALLAPFFANGQLMADDLVFSEVLPNPSGGDRGQYIELYNPTGGALDLSGYMVCNSATTVCTHLFGEVAASTYYTLCRDISQYAFCNIGTGIDMSVLSSLSLIGPDSSVADTVTWGSSAPTGQAYARGIDQANLLNFAWTAPTPGGGFLSAEVPPTPAPVAPVTPSPVTPAPTPQPVTPAPTKAPTPACETKSCHVNGECTESGGVATCACKAGFAGNGETDCQDVDECTQDPAPCSANGFCVNNDGTFTCGCNNGFSGDGFNCVDDNECLSNPCGANAACTNTGGSFTCACNPGFDGDPLTLCSDVNECTRSTFPCNMNAFCINTAGTFSCVCNSGFVGDGFTCSDADGCADSPCDDNASCSDGFGTFTCTCNLGFTGNGLSCVATPTSPPTPGPTTTPPIEFSNPPSILPTISGQPSISDSPSLTKNPSNVPSLSNEPSKTEFPSIAPSLSNVPSVTDTPSSKPSLSDAPTV